MTRAQRESPSHPGRAGAKCRSLRPAGGCGGERSACLARLSRVHRHPLHPHAHPLGKMHARTPGDIGGTVVRGESAGRHHGRERQRHRDRGRVPCHGGWPAAHRVVGDPSRDGQEGGDRRRHRTDGEARDAPAAVSPATRFRSTSSGHSVEAATANTRPTLRDSSNDEAASANGMGNQATHDGGDPEVAHPATQQIRSTPPRRC